MLLRGLRPPPQGDHEHSLLPTGRKCLVQPFPPEMQKVADAADISVLFFSAGANFWPILGHFWAILANLGHFLANLDNFG